MTASLRGSTQDARELTAAYVFRSTSDDFGSGSDAGSDAGAYPKYAVGWKPTVYTLPPYEDYIPKPTPYTPKITYYDYDTSGITAWQILRIFLAVALFLIALLRCHYRSQRRQERLAQERAAQDQANGTAFAAIVETPSKPHTEPAVRNN